VAEMTSGKASNDELKATVGVTVALDLASVILSNLANCKDDIYLLLSQLSGMTTKEIAKLPMMTFVEMVIEVIKKKEFADFFQDAVKLFK
jgi:fructose 1,6-bisphosphatase